MTFMQDIYAWCRDHRVHHKFSDTNADPHNANRGFFFAHVGWLFCKKHPDIIEKGKQVDLQDLLADPVVRFHRKYYIPLATILFFLPTLIPIYFWQESFTNALFISSFLRVCLVQHQTWLVNSAAHLYGYRPYDVNIQPRESTLTKMMTLGEGGHNFHHTFPYDYAANECEFLLNWTKIAIDVFAFLGLAYDRKTATKKAVEDRKKRTECQKSKSN